MKHKKQIGRVACMSLLCLAASFVVLTSAADAKTKTKGKVCKGVQWSYSSSKQTLTISGKGYAKISGFKKQGTYEWPASGDSSLPVFKKIVFKDGITKIDYAYFTMEGIKSISLPKTLKSIVYNKDYRVNGKYEPYSTTLKKISVNKKNKNFSASNGVLYSKNKKTLYVYPSGKTVNKYIVGKTVTKIANYAFYGSDIQTVKLSAKLTSIGDNAFYNSTITTLQTNKKLKKIGKEAFYKTDLGNVVFPDTLTTIGSNAFEYCPMTAVVLPKSVTKIGYGAFANNTKLKKIVINCNCDLENIFYYCSRYFDAESYEQASHEISVTLSKNVTAPLSGLIEDLGTKITFTIEAGNKKYYMKDGSLYLVRGNKLQYTPDKPEPTQKPEEQKPSTEEPSPETPSPTPDTPDTTPETPSASTEA